jgi:hypothetical protein
LELRKVLTRFQVVMAAVVANRRLAAGVCWRQAEQVGAAAEKTSAGLGDKLFTVVLTFWERYFGWNPPLSV